MCACVCVRARVCVSDYVCVCVCDRERERERERERKGKTTESHPVILDIDLEILRTTSPLTFTPSHVSGSTAASVKSTSSFWGRTNNGFDDDWLKSMADTETARQSTACLFGSDGCSGRENQIRWEVATIFISIFTHIATDVEPSSL